jgi:hypothetical protein
MSLVIKRMAHKGLDGRQYIVVAVSGGAYSGEFLSFALPASGMRTTGQGGHDR